MKNQTLYLVLTFLMYTPLHGHAEVYKWVDEQGRTHYGEKPPVADAREIKIKNSTGAEESLLRRNEESEKLLKVYEEERALKNEERQKAEEEEKKREEKCMVAENELKDMKQEGLRYYDLDEKGDRKFLSDTELQQRISKLQEQYDQNCN